MGKLVSAIVTTHKRPADIVCRAVKSIIAQSYAPMEIIVVDDSPNNYSERELVVHELHKLSDNIIIVQHETPRGACAARNSGIAHSSAEYIAFLDDDDEWLPTKIEEQMRVMERSDAALVYCKSFSVTNEDYVNKTIRQAPMYRGDVYNQLLESNFIGSTSFPLINKQCLIDVGSFDTQMKSAQDYDLWARIAKKYKVDFVELPLVYYHYHTIGQITKNPSNAIAGLERFWKKNESEILLNRHAYYCRCMEIAPYYAKTGEKKRAISVWLKGVLKEPWNLTSNIRKIKTIIETKR